MHSLLKKCAWVSLFAVLMFAAASGHGKKGHGTIKPFDLQLRALNGPSSTDIYINVTSCDLQKYPLPDKLKKVQIKLKSRRGKHAYVKNYKSVDLSNGSAVITVADPLANNLLEVSAHIKTKKSVNEKILKGETAVVLRPDLIVSDVLHPDTLNSGAPFGIEAYITEINMQTGAKANVALFEGDSLIRKVDSVNIDAGGGASVQFQNLTYQGSGEVNYRVAITNSSPAEYCITNNDSSFNLYFKNPVHLTAMAYNASYSVNKNTRKANYDYSCDTTVSITEGQSSGFQCYYTRLNVYLNTAGNKIDFNSAAVNIITENGNFANINFTSVPGTYTSYGYIYGYTYDPNTGIMFYYRYDYNKNELTFSLTQSLSDLVYINQQNGVTTVQENHNEIIDAKQKLDIDLAVHIDTTYYGGRIEFNSFPPLQHSESVFSYTYLDPGCGTTATHVDTSSGDSFNTSISGITDVNYLGKFAARKIEVKTPTAAELYPNYPNPFNPTTTIKYNLSRAGYVNLTVYDMLGNEVAVLVSRGEKEGVHSVQFNATNLASGVYIYRLRTPGYSLTRKLILQK